VFTLKKIFYSYARYLKEDGFNIGIKIIKPKNMKNNQHTYLKTIKFRVALSNFSDVGVLFSLIKTLKSFPFEIKKINIKSGRKIDAVINAELVGIK
jgi:EAL domain-containing protein (putative c-di-GMP-specific phosphodiesterase class I)